MDVQEQAEDGAPLGAPQSEDSQEKVALYLELAARLRCTAIGLPRWRFFLRSKMLRDAAKFAAFAREEVKRGC